MSTPSLVREEFQISDIDNTNPLLYYPPQMEGVKHMKNSPILSIVLISSIMLLAAGANMVQAQANTNDALASLLEADRSFSSLCGQRGPRDAFLVFLADTSIIFKPGPVEGRSYYEQTAPGKSPALTWTPELAEISGSGDLGYTSGQFQSKNFGHYVTGWQKGDDGTWKAFVDIGVEHGQAASLPSAQLQGDGRTAAVDSPARKKLSDGLRDQAMAFYKDVTAKGYLGTFGNYAAKDIRIMRAGQVPAIGLEAASGILKANEGKAMVPKSRGTANLDNDIVMYVRTADSGDLGFAYGSYSLPNGKNKDSIDYLWIWRKAQSDKWRLALVVILPFK